jgi:Arc/MetJ family transcription regulator
MRMKRTNLVLDEQLLDRAKAASGLRTYSQVVNEALSEFVRLKTFATIDQYASRSVWEGDLAVMREDHDETR